MDENDNNHHHLNTSESNGRRRNPLKVVSGPSAGHHHSHLDNHHHQHGGDSSAATSSPLVTGSTERGEEDGGSTANAVKRKKRPSKIAGISGREQQQRPSSHPTSLRAAASNVVPSLSTPSTEAAEHAAGQLSPRRSSLGIKSPRTRSSHKSSRSGGPPQTVSFANITALERVSPSPTASGSNSLNNSAKMLMMQGRSRARSYGSSMLPTPMAIVDQQSNEDLANSGSTSSPRRSSMTVDNGDLQRSGGASKSLREAVRTSQKQAMRRRQSRGVDDQGATPVEANNLNLLKQRIKWLDEKAKLLAELEELRNELERERLARRAAEAEIARLKDQGAQSTSSSEPSGLLAKMFASKVSSSEAHKAETAQLHLRYRDANESFWFGKVGGSNLAIEDPVQLSDRERRVLSRIRSYTSKLAVRRLRLGSDIKPPAVERYHSCVMFADISGFTPLMERTAKRGQEGVEVLTRCLNEFFSELIRIIYEYGGDVVKFAGDAVLAHWPSLDANSTGHVMMAVQCALDIQDQLHNFSVEGGSLQLHVGIAAGDLCGLFVGGEQDQVEFLIFGEPLDAVSSCEKEAAPGEVFVSSTTWGMIESAVKGTRPKGKQNYLLREVTRPLPRVGSHLMPVTSEMEKPLKRLVAPAVRNQLDNSVTGEISYLAELRNISVAFCNLGLEVNGGNVRTTVPRVQEAFSKLQRVVAEFDGTVRQFIIDDKGCVLIAAWGVPPKGHEDDPARAVLAALSMVRAAGELGIMMSVGVTTGQTFCGDVGSTERREYAIVGDVVNLAARLMATGSGVLCDRNTYRFSAKEVDFIELPTIRVKGKAEPVHVYKPRGKHADTTKAKPEMLSGVVANFSRELIGRESEMSQLREELLAVKEHSPAQSEQQVASNDGELKEAGDVGGGSRVVIIEGEAGLGKSRLLAELITEAKHERVPVLRGIGTEMDAGGSAYQPWKGVVTQAARHAKRLLEDCIDELGENSELLFELLGVTRAHVGASGISQSTLVPKNSAKTAKVRAKSSEAARELSGQERSQEEQRLMLALLKNLVTRGSVIILENAQWLPSASWKLLVLACGELQNVLIVLSARPVTVSGVSFDFYKVKQRASAVIDLKPFSKESDTARLACCLLGLKSLPLNLTQELHRKAQGIPFIIVEMVTAFMDIPGFADDLRKRGEISNVPQVVNFVQNTMPRNVDALIISKVDKLTTFQQSELKCASVIGTSFTVDMLMLLLPPDTERQRVVQDLLFMCKNGLLKQAKHEQDADDSDDEKPESTEESAAKSEAVGSTVAPDAVANANESASGVATSDVATSAAAAVAGKKAKKKKGKAKGKVKGKGKGGKVKGKSASGANLIASIDVVDEEEQSGGGDEEDDDDVEVVDQVEGDGEQIEEKGGDLDADDDTGVEEQETQAVSTKPNARDVARKVSKKKISRKKLTKNRTTPELRRKKKLDKSAAQFRSTPAIMVNETEQGAQVTTTNSEVPGELKSSASGREIITEEEDEDEDRFEFANTRSHEAIYNLMLFAQRRELHDKVALQMQREHADSWEHLPAIAHHFKCAENWGKALQYFLKAGDRAAKTNNAVEAVALYGEANQIADRVFSPDSSVLSLLEAVSLKRKYAQSSYNLGMLTTSGNAVRAALELLEFEIPSGSSHKKLKVNLKKRDRERAQQDMDATREAIICLVVLSKICYFECQKSLATYVSALALELASVSKNEQLLVEVYCTSVLIAATNRDEIMCVRHIEDGSRLAQANGQVAELGRILLSGGMYYSGIGRWATAEKCFSEALRISVRTGDKRMWEECQTFVATSWFLQGNLKEAVRVASLALDSARSRGDLQTQLMCLLCQARNMYFLGHNDECVAFLEEANAAFESIGTPDASSDLVHKTLLALTRFQAGKLAEAYAMLREVVKHLEKVQPTTYFTSTVYLGCVEIYVKLLRSKDKDLASLSISKAKLSSEMDTALSLLYAFDKLFPISAPRSLLWKGVEHALKEKFSKAEAKFKLAMEKAVELDMLFDQGVILFYRGIYSRDAREAGMLTKKSFDIFQQLGVGFDKQL